MQQAERRLRTPSVALEIRGCRLESHASRCSVWLCPAFTMLLAPLPTFKKRECGRSCSCLNDALSSHGRPCERQCVPGRWGARLSFPRSGSARHTLGLMGPERAEVTLATWRGICSRPGSGMRRHRAQPLPRVCSRNSHEPLLYVTAVWGLFVTAA